MEPIKFDISDTVERKIKKVFKSQVEFSEDYLTVRKEYYCDDINKDDTTPLENFFLSYVDTIFKDTITGISYSTVYVFPNVDFDDKCWEMNIFYGCATAYMHFKTEKEVIAARDKILNWKLNKI